VSTVLLAIDPGAISGAYAAFFESGAVTVGDLPTADGQVDAATFHALVREMSPMAAVVERVASMPKQGVASTFKFGMSVGLVHGVLLANGVPVHLVVPSKWKKNWGLLHQDKDAARALALRLYPNVTGLSRKKDVGRADALLMGQYFRGFGPSLWQPGKGENDE
jgi:crossover junction endodeoxyribonuclease RuvC